MYGGKRIGRRKEGHMYKRAKKTMEAEGASVVRGVERLLASDQLKRRRR